MNSSVSSIRQEFLNYFKEHGHTEVESSKLIPENDPTLLFTNAGMVQFKDVFTGKKTMAFKRATTAQKCLRAGGKHNDLENVGYTSRHHTFFEMLGNFSFGDYFKKEVISFAWEFITKHLCLEPSRLLITVHSSDENAAKYWKSITGFSDNKIIRISTNDNFWSMGNTGPCGPCSEIFYDHGDKIQGGPPGSKDEDGDRFVEIWNLVFMQFETLPDGTRINLPKPSIDTGMGLERIAAVLQGVNSNFDIDLFQIIIHDITNITNKSYRGNEAHNNVIADHIRAISFMIADGVIPSNEGRGYVLRRIIRRALRHGYALNMREPFLYKLVRSVVETMGHHYKELNICESNIAQILQSEEHSFMKTIDNGMSILQKELDNLGTNTVFPADMAYKLYDTFGFPLDLTQDVLRSQGKTVNEKEFDKLLINQKENSRKNWIGTGDILTDKVWYTIAENKDKIEFFRNTDQLESKVLYIIQNNNIVQSIHRGSLAYIILDKTPFYAQAGGQVGDTGTIVLGHNLAEVVDTQKIAELIIHKCIVNQGAFKANDIVIATIDKYRRLAISRNHTATHLLHSALKKVLGNHVFQQGSLVSPDKLRFDFCYDKSLTTNEIQDIEEIVLKAIDDSIEVKTEIMNKAEALNQGAIAIFSEKYPEQVRVVSIANKSKELCFGEHVKNTSQIGAFKIVSISSNGAQTQRIEAVTGRVVRKSLEDDLHKQKLIIDEQAHSIYELSKEIEQLQSQNFINNTKTNTETINNVIFQYLLVNDNTQKNILSLIDRTKEMNDKICLIVGNKSSKNNKIAVCILVTKELQKEITIKNIIAILNNNLTLNIKINNRPDLVQFGGINDTIFDQCKQQIKKYLNTL